MNANEGALQVGDVLKGRYRIAGEGKPQDIGTLYPAYDSRYERTVALLLLAHRFRGGGDAVRRLMEGQQPVIDLAIPELIPVEDAGVAGGQIYLVRSLVDGRTLADLHARAGHLSFDRAVQIAIRLCDALAPLHRAGLVHGSLSPYSVLVQDSGDVLVTDAGLFPALRPVPASPGEPWGRVPYLSPEQAAGERVQPSSDVYVIGSLLYYLLAGRPPFQAQDEAVLVVRHLRHDPPSLPVLAPGIPPHLVEIVQKSLVKEPAVRYCSAGQLAHILRSRVGRGWSVPVIPPPEPVHPSVPAGTYTRERLVVPPPPIPGRYQPDMDMENWSDEPATADWLMVALIVLALVSVLGLIPLWRTVYRRYAAPPVTPLPALSLLLVHDLAWLSLGPTGLAGGTMARSKLDDSGLVWYNLSIANRPAVALLETEQAGFGRIPSFGSQDYAIQEQCVIYCECID